MLKTLMMTTTAVALVVGSAVAQYAGAGSPKAPPMQKSETMPAPGATGSRQFVTLQSADQWLATKFKGTDVIGSNNEKIGDVNDILIDQNGRIVAYVVGVGGFLGIGQKDVALAPSRVPGATGDRPRGAQAQARHDPRRTEERAGVQGRLPVRLRRPVRPRRVTALRPRRRRLRPAR